MTTARLLYTSCFWACSYGMYLGDCDWAPEGVAFLLDEVQCTGDEYDLLSCARDPWWWHDCASLETAGCHCCTSHGSCTGSLSCSAP